MAARRRPRLSRKLLAAAAAVAARKARASWAEWDDNVELDRWGGWGDRGAGACWWGDLRQVHAGMVGPADRYYSTAQRLPRPLAAINTGTAPTNSQPTAANVAPSPSNLQDILHPDHLYVCSLHAPPAAGRPTAHDLGRARTEWRVPGHAGIGGGAYTVRLAALPAQLHLLPHLLPASPPCAHLSQQKPCCPCRCCRHRGHSCCCFAGLQRGGAPVSPFKNASRNGWLTPCRRVPCHMRAMPLLCRSFCPSAYRRHAPALRLAFVLYAFSFPVFSSLPAMEAFVGPAPSASTSPFLNLLVDGYRLWMGACMGSSSVAMWPCGAHGPWPQRLAPCPPPLRFPWHAPIV